MVKISAPISGIEGRRRCGAEWRRRLPLADQADWRPPARRSDPIDILVEQGKSRIAELLPVRYARMKADPFAFLRGAAAIMAADLGAMPATDLRVQACGDCHLDNLGAYASPEGAGPAPGARHRQAPSRRATHVTLMLPRPPRCDIDVVAFG